MLINSLILSLSSSIDSFGIGITYGIKNTKISYFAKFILFAISFGISVLSICFGSLIKNIFSDAITKLLANLILIGIGIFVCFQDPSSSDLDCSNSIDSKEALILGFALSLDSFCIGTCGSVLGIHFLLFPLFISTFQFIFLSVGNRLGKKLYRFRYLSDRIWSVISGLLLILIGIFRFFLA